MQHLQSSHWADCGKCSLNNLNSVDFFPRNRLKHCGRTDYWESTMFAQAIRKIAALTKSSPFQLKALSMPYALRHFTSPPLDSHRINDTPHKILAQWTHQNSAITLNAQRQKAKCVERQTVVGVMWPILCIVINRIEAWLGGLCCCGQSEFSPKQTEYQFFDSINYVTSIHHRIIAIWWIGFLWAANWPSIDNLLGWCP